MRCLAVGLLVALMLAGQSRRAQEVPTPVFSAETREVPVNVTVTDSHGRFVLDLQQSAFQILEDGVLQPIKIFRREDIPVSLGLVVDNSGSMRGKRQAVESAALTLVKDSNPSDETLVINFNDEAFLDVDFTNDIELLRNGLQRIDSRGGTAMREAIRLAIERLHNKGKRDKKVVVVVTDGNDNLTDPSFNMQKLVQIAQKNDVLVYAVALLNEEIKSEAAKAKRELTMLTQETGGQAYYPKDLSEVESIAHQVARDLRNQYTIVYSPLNAAQDGSFRSIKVLVKAPGNPTARARLGYWAKGTPDPAPAPPGR